MRSRRIIIALGALLAVAAVAGWVLLSPAWTLRQMAAAAQTNDADRLASYVDFPALRANAKSQLRQQLVSGVAAGEGLDALGAMVALALVDPAVDAMITPEALEAAFANRSRQAVPVAPSAPSGRSLPGLPRIPKNAQIDRQGLNAFVLRDPARPDRGLRFERRGLGWRLVGIELGAAQP